jgi:hypothetical protein
VNINTAGTALTFPRANRLPKELLRIERHHSVLITVGIILPTESNLVMLESHEAMVGDGYAMGIAGEINPLSTTAPA